MKRSGLSGILLAAALIALVGGGAWLAPQLRDGGGAAPAAAPACDINASACRVALPAGGSVELSITPRPIPTLAPLAISATVTGSELRARSLDFSGVDMDMGSTRATLAADPGNSARFVGSTQLPVCSTGRMRWRATLQLEDASGVGVALPFGFDSGSANGAPAAAAGPARATDFTLLSASGPVSLRDFRGKLVVLYFGYTYCPDVCPTALTVIAQALQQLTADERGQVQTIFVSVDPARDTPEKLRDYVAFFDKGIIGVSGSAAETAATARAWGVYYAAQPADANGRYSVDHSAFTALVDGDGKLVARLPHATTPAELASRLRDELKRNR